MPRPLLCCSPDHQSPAHFNTIRLARQAMDTCKRALALIRLTIVAVPDFVCILQYTHTYRKPISSL